MRKQIVRIVALPDGKKVSVSDAPLPWWGQDDATGYVDPSHLAPDPDQPRKFMSEARLAELEKSIETCGVREAITVTPRELAPWVRLKSEHEKLPFIIVSGHRRAGSAQKSLLPAVPVRIKIYSDENAHRTDGGVLNACREALSELEQGFEFVRERQAGKSISQIADTHGINRLTVEYRINLTRLHPDLFSLLESDSKNKKRVLPIYPASILGGVKAPESEELEALAMKFADFVNAREATGHSSFENLEEDERRFAMQKLLAAVIVNRGLNSVRAADFIRDLTLTFKNGNGRQKTQRYQPARRKDILLNLAKEVSGSTIVDWTPEEFKRIFSLSSREDDDVLIHELQAAQDVISKTIQIVSKIRDSKRVTSAEVLNLIRRRKVSA